MNFHFTERRALSRRTFLKGIGVSLALPSIEAMTPAFAVAADVAKTPRRLVAIQTNLGIMPHLFFPEKDGPGYEPSHYLKILEQLHSDFTVFSGLGHPGVDGGHANEKVFLTGAPHPAGAGFRNTVSLDQVVADQLGNQTRIPSLTLNVSPGMNSSSMSFTSAGVLIPGEASVAALYKRLFIQGSKEDVKARVDDLKAGRSLLDSVGARAKQMGKAVGASDRNRLDQYFTSIRELEKQLHQAEAWEHKPKPKVEAPEPREFTEGGQLLLRLGSMLDVIRLALETDSTRVVSLYIQPLGVLSAVEGVQHETHSLTHHGNRPEMVAELQKIEEAQFKTIARFLLALRGAGESGASLLDRTSVVYGTCMGNANGHTNKNWPMLLAGGGFKHGQHLAFDKEQNYPIANLYVSLLQRLGIEADKFASSKGTLKGLEMAG
jgi:hypothetical protein